jgi:hypothetical protein
MLLGARLGIDLAPFFVVREEDGREAVYESVLMFIRERLTSAPEARAAASGTDDIEAAARELAEREPS